MAARYAAASSLKKGFIIILFSRLAEVVASNQMHSVRFAIDLILDWVVQKSMRLPWHRLEWSGRSYLGFQCLCNILNSRTSNVS